jgi:hypothetical protein
MLGWQVPSFGVWPWGGTEKQLSLNGSSSASH